MTQDNSNNQTSKGTGLQFPDDIVFNGYAAPVRLECDVYDCEVEGSIPPELNGAFYRASADHQYPPLHGKDIFLNGDGMIHMVRFENGHADLKTRFVQTEKFKRERAERRALGGYYRNVYFDDPIAAGMSKDTGNTAVMWHNNMLFALKEDAHPVLMDPKSLETKGTWDFDGKLTGKSFTAHPKKDPLTGEMVAFGYCTSGNAEPNNLLDVMTISPQGEITSYETLELPYANMMHDCMLSRNYIALVIAPNTCDLDRIKNGEPFWHWDPELTTYMVVIPRKEGVKAARWFECPNTVMETHSFNAWEEGSVLHCDHFINTSGWLSQFPNIRDPEAQEAPPMPERWSVDMGDPNSEMDISQIFNQIGEMPIVDSRYVTQKTDNFFFGTFNAELGPMLEFGPKGPPFNCLGRYKASSDQYDFFYPGPNAAPEEPCFVPKPGGKEGEGWLLTIVGRRDTMLSELAIVDATNLSAGPVATVKFPCRVHEGFHGIWVSEGQLRSADAW